MIPPSAGKGKRFPTTRRREIARACSFGARTAGDIARQLGTDRGAVVQAVKALANEGVLRETTAPHSDGVAYELVKKYRAELFEAIGADSPRGQLLPNLRLLVIGSRDAGAFARAVAAVAADPVVVWSARVDGYARLVVAARAETDGERTRIDRLEALIADEGLDCAQLRVDRVMELSELLGGYAHTLARRPLPPELPAP